MHRDNLLSQLERYGKAHPDQLDTVKQIEDFVTRNETCFDRELEEGHITGSGFIVDQSGTRTLLTHHRKLNLWLQPGGHADGDSDVQGVAMKECLEETGLDSLVAVSDEIFDIDVHGIPARKADPAHFHYDIRYLFQQEGGDDYIVTEESHDLAWVALTKLEDYTSEWSMRRMRDKALRLFP